MVLLIDHDDSFVYNLARYVDVLGWETTVCRHDTITCDAIEALRPSHIILSPGPGRPEQFPNTTRLIQSVAGRIPLLGVCLGHQAIAHAYGVSIIQASEPMHGRASFIKHQDHFLFSGLPNPFLAGRYHALIVSKDCFLSVGCSEFEIIAESERGEIMAISHRLFSMWGVQFHPESILTGRDGRQGMALLQNFLRTLLR